MAFSREIIAAAWDRQGGKCAYCGKTLNFTNRDSGEFGAWHPHHRKPEYISGTDTLQNCVILCINPPNCHFNIGHGGISWEHYKPLSDSELPYLYYSKKITVVNFWQTIRPIGVQTKKPVRKKRKSLRRYTEPRAIMPRLSSIKLLK